MQAGSRQEEPSQGTANAWRGAAHRPTSSAAAEKENRPDQAAYTPASGLELHFSAEQSALERRVRVPDRFAGGATEYAIAWKAAVQEEMNLRQVADQRPAAVDAAIQQALT